MMKLSLFKTITLTLAFFITSKADIINDEDGYVSLLNENDLSGWEIKTTSKANFSVKDGILTGEAKNLNKTSYLGTKRNYKDFILKFSFKFDSMKGNSGCMFRAQLNEEAKTVYGYQCEHDNKVERSWTAGLFDQSRRGWLVPYRPKKTTKSLIDSLEASMVNFTVQGKRLTKLDNQWNDIIIKCEGRRIQIWLNKELRVDFMDNDAKKFTPEGFLALQVHSGKECKVSWKNLRIKELGENEN